MTRRGHNKKGQKTVPLLQNEECARIFYFFAHSFYILHLRYYLKDITIFAPYNIKTNFIKT